jgi:hypothetical protein
MHPIFWHNFRIAHPSQIPALLARFLHSLHPSFQARIPASLARFSHSTSITNPSFIGTLFAQPPSLISNPHPSIIMPFHTRRRGEEESGKYLEMKYFF